MSNHAFCLGVNELSGMVFAQPISGKAWSQLEPVLVKFLQTQPYTRTVVSDGEAALSVKNIKALKLKLKKPYLKLIRAPKHAYMAERYIRTIKTKLAEYSRQAGLHIQKSWKKNLPKVIKYLNARPILPGKLAPMDVNLTNFLNLELKVNQNISAPLLTAQAKDFKYKVGEKVWVKDRALKFPQPLGIKCSLQGYNSTVASEITEREIRVTGGNWLSPYYKLKRGGWFREADLSTF